MGSNYKIWWSHYIFFLKKILYFINKVGSADPPPTSMAPPLCIIHNNPSAHYVVGIEDYSLYKNIDSGLHHLWTAAAASQDHVIYLYGLLMLCIGNFNEWSAYLFAWLGGVQTKIKYSLGIHTYYTRQNTCQEH